MPAIRRATPDDMPALLALEEACYDPARRESPATIRRSLHSPHQSVWVIEDSRGLAADLYLWHHKKTVRVYGVAVRPDVQGKGFGRALVLHAETLSPGRIVLEADAADERLLYWYEAQGYVKQDLMPDYYAPGRHAWRLEKRT